MPRFRTTLTAGLVLGTALTLGFLWGQGSVSTWEPPTHVCAEPPALPTRSAGLCGKDSPTTGPIVFHTPIRTP